MGATQYRSGGAGKKSAFARFSASFNFRLFQHYLPTGDIGKEKRPPIEETVVRRLYPG